MLQEGKTILTSGTQTLATGNVRDWYAGTEASCVAVHSHAELVLHCLWKNRVSAGQRGADETG